MPRKREEVARRARSVFDDYHDGELSILEISRRHRISVAQVRKDVGWWWAHHREFESGGARKRPRKRKRKQCYDELWDWGPEQLTVALNGFGVGWVADQMGSSRTTVWRAIKAKGLRRGPDGKYRVQPPHPQDPDYLRMLESSPRRGPTAVIVGNGQEIFGGRQREKAPAPQCPHEFETRELPDPLGLRPPEILYRCRHCAGVVRP